MACRTHCDCVRTVERKGSHGNSSNSSYTTYFFALIERIFNFTNLKQVTAWIMRFVNNCRHHLKEKASQSGPFTIHELVDAEAYWIAVVQQSDFGEEI